MGMIIGPPPEVPEPPEKRVKFRGKFYQESEYKKYKDSMRCKVDSVVQVGMFILFIFSIIALFLSVILEKTLT